MAFAAVQATDSSRIRNPISLGQIKAQAMTWTCLSTDTTGTITAPTLAEATFIILDGINQTAAATYSGNVVTLTFAAPGTTGATAGDVIVFGT
jgi:phage baseplate assembly protein gpV